MSKNTKISNFNDASGKPTCYHLSSDKAVLKLQVENSKLAVNREEISTLFEEEGLTVMVMCNGETYRLYQTFDEVFNVWIA